MTTAVDHVPLHHRKYGAKDPKRRLIGWAVVILVHAVVLWALITGTARDSSKSTQTMQAALIQEVIIPPSTPPAPPPRQIKPPQPAPPKPQTPPPTYVPPPEVTPPAAAPAPLSVPTPPPAPPVIASPQAAPAVPAAPASAQDIAVVCPTQVKPKMPPQAIKQGIEGLVKAEAIVRGGKVVEVNILSGPRVFHSAVRDAMMQFVCISGPADITVTKDFLFKFE